jgi:hypothetical protein
MFAWDVSKPPSISCAIIWCAVQHGRVPALILQSGYNLTRYAADAFEDRPSEYLRKRCLAAVVTCQINDIPTTAASRKNFRRAKTSGRTPI